MLIKIVMLIWLSSFVFCNENTPKNTGASSNNVKVFDDGIFNVGKLPEPEVGTITTPKGTFYKAPPAKFNREQKEKALEACAIEKDKDLELYRKCYQNELAIQTEGVKEKIKNIEKKQAQPLKNVPLIDNKKKAPLIEEEYD